MNLAGPAELANSLEQHLHRRRADDRILDQEHLFALEHFAQGRVLRSALAAVAGAFDKRAARVPIADQALDHGNFELVGHRVGGSLARVGHRDDDRVGVDGRRLEPGQLLAQLLPREIDALPVHRAGHVGKVDPLEEAVGPAGRPGEGLDLEAALVNRHGLAGQQRADTLGLEAEVEQCHALAGGGEQRSLLGIAQRPDTQRVASHEHLTEGIQDHEVVGPVEPPADRRITSISGGRRRPTVRG